MPVIFILKGVAYNNFQINAISYNRDNKSFVHYPSVDVVPVGRLMVIINNKKGD